MLRIHDAALSRAICQLNRGIGDNNSESKEIAQAWYDSRHQEVAGGYRDSVGRGGFQELIKSQLVDVYLL